MKHPKKLQTMLDRLKWQELKYTATVLCEYQIKPKLDEYEVEDDNNYKRLYFRQMGSLGLDMAIYELIKDKKITYLCIAETCIGGDYSDEELTVYKHPNYTEIFVCDNIDDYAEEITPESHAKLLYEIINGDYDENTGEYLGYSGDYGLFLKTCG